MEGRCSASVPGGMLRVVVSAPICQNAIRQTMEALISTSRPIIFKWLLAEECNQSITDKILLKASLFLSCSLSLSLFLHCSSFLPLVCFWQKRETVSFKRKKEKKNHKNFATLLLKVFVINGGGRQCSRCSRSHTRHQSLFVILLPFAVLEAVSRNEGRWNLVRSNVVMLVRRYRATAS